MNAPVRVKKHYMTFSISKEVLHNLPTTSSHSHMSVKEEMNGYLLNAIQIMSFDNSDVRNKVLGNKTFDYIFPHHRRSDRFAVYVEEDKAAYIVNMVEISDNFSRNGYDIRFSMDEITLEEALEMCYESVNQRKESSRTIPKLLKAIEYRDMQQQYGITSDLLDSMLDGE